MSPKFNKWKALKKMKDASKFASFIDGEGINFYFIFKSKSMKMINIYRLYLF